MKYLFVPYLFLLLTQCDNVNSASSKVLIFSKTAGFRHESIASGIKLFEKLAKENDFEIVKTEDADKFNPDFLNEFKTIVFLNTTGDILNPNQQKAMEDYMKKGGGFLGIHAAADTEHHWPWYGKLVGAYFKNHPNNPNVRSAEIECLDNNHQCCKHLPKRWQRSDEWYNYKTINPDVNVVLNLDEATYKGGTNGANHPIAWFHEYGGGRAFYTGGGHTHEAFLEPAFAEHILGALEYVMKE